VWAGFNLASETYAFWRYGIEKTARVVALDHTSRALKGGTTFYYVIEIERHRFVKDFRVRLPEGRDVAVLSLPQDPDNLTIGNSKSSAFEIFSYSIGGKVWATLVLAMFCLVILAGPKTLIAWIRARRQIIDG
jgi:hypothetical protein